MVILHAFLALLAGFATMAVVVMVMTMLLARLTPDWAGVAGPPHRGYILVVLAYSYLAAGGGGYVTAWLAESHPLEHVLTLGMAVLLLSGLSAMLTKSDQPTLYQVALVAILPIGVLAGGIVRMKLMGIM